MFELQRHTPARYASNEHVHDGGRAWIRMGRLAIVRLIYTRACLYVDIRPPLRTRAEEQEHRSNKSNWESP